MKYNVLAPRSADGTSALDQSVWQCFDPQVLTFIDVVSKRILNNPEYRQFPELVALAYWMRKANILRLKESFEATSAETVRIGRGVVFHIAPANVDTIFVYSWLLSMLVGNTNIVRISSRSGPQIEALMREINAVAEQSDSAEVKKRFLIVQYEHNPETTAHFSSLCDVPRIWGGDDTIKAIRAIPINPTATELTFADKFSFAVINADSFLKSAKQEIIAQSFFNDAYLFNQLACSSPRVVFWLGSPEPVTKARSVFWELLQRVLKLKRVELAPASAMDKLVSQHSLAIGALSAKLEPTENNLLNRVWLSRIEDISRAAHCGQGLFYELAIEQLSEIIPFVTPKEQTMTVFGIGRKELQEYISRHRPKGINRIVPIGEALTFSPVWDSYDLFQELTRLVDITVPE